MASIHPTEQALWDHMRREGLTRPGERVIISVSGGGDSLALLLLLHALRDRLGLDLEVLHFDHGLRPESASEAEWVAERTRGLGLPFHLRRSEALSGRRAGVQAAARSWRREESLNLLRSRPAHWIATGHQHDDHLETLMMKLLRGVHLAHIRGLKPREGHWIRPLLPFSHVRLTEYLSDLGERWLEDPSNRSRRYKRNRVRHELLPLMDQLADGGIGRRLLTLEKQSAALAGWLAETESPRQSAAGAAYHWIDSDALCKLPALAGAESLHRFIVERIPGALDASTIDRALHLLKNGAPVWDLHLPRRRVLKRRGARLLLQCLDSAVPPDEHRVGSWRVKVPAGMQIALRTSSGDEAAELAIHNIPADATLEIRTRLPGDRIRPPRRASPVKVNEFLRGRGVPLWERERTPLVVAAGQVVAVYPYCVAWGHDCPRGEGGSLHIAIDGWI